MKRLLFILPLVIYGCGSSERPDSEVVVDESALSVYTRENYPRTFQKWGDSGIERIKNVERAALFKAGKQTRCDQVEYVGLSEKLSNPPDKIVVYADCRNRWRYYIDEGNEIVQSERTN
ncbi:hypothetical protein JET76_20555 [Pseudomonas putida]|jgi:hypothetical protein|uniref:Lipoprotein n=1 Tax=Pseudomonas juntendi TaxID=2666183 RepID=A0ABD4YH01_9PSED|nr:MULTISPECIES: hypothetical protein [Pseudomonas]NOY02394.1 hypothetical protein [Gammaproteobacteria bacterium]MBH3375481.1 hypothetical protein [Pseudomonas juntendi]MBI6943729.1 hypothetical protein [Pseudomonas putida]MBI6959814.1 hypothetical protein [Pseudomonas putida]MBR7523595.1 hypothetical protein [Pseudomonas juntendi]